MSQTHHIPDRSARPIGELITVFGRRKAKGDPSSPTDPVHRDSYDVEDPRAQPWLDRPFNESLVRIDEKAILAAFDAMMATEALELAKARAAQRAARREGREPAAAERPMPAADRLHDRDRRLQVYYLDYHRFTKGRAFPSIATAADALGIPVSEVKASRRRLKARGLLNWQRRSRKVPNMAGKPGWHRRQTSCVYFLHDVAQRLVGKARQAFIETRARLLRKRGATPQAVRPTRSGDHACATHPGLAADLLRLGKAVIARDAALNSASP